MPLATDRTCLPLFAASAILSVVSLGSSGNDRFQTSPAKRKVAEVEAGIHCAITPSPPGWRFCRVHPWVEADADQLATVLTEPAERIDLAGPRNDWLTGAVGIATGTNTCVTVRLHVSEPLKERIQLRVVGQVQEREKKQWVWDPLFAEGDLLTHGRSVRNFEYIKGFPRIAVAPSRPAFLWLTVDLRNVPSGQYDAELRADDDRGQRASVPIHITALDAELPIDNPLFCFAWQWTTTRPAMIREFIDHGINVFHTQHEAAWKTGAKFCLFVFEPSWKRKPLDDAQRTLVKEHLDRIWETVERLKIPRDRWAVYPADEPCDQTAAIDHSYAMAIRSLRPETPIWFNSAWGKLAGSDRNNTTVDGTFRKLASVTDIWCPYSAHLWDGSGALEFMRSTGKRMWFGEIWGNAARRPSVGRQMLRQSSWLAWKYRVEGFGVYAANAWVDDPWNDLDGATSDYAFTYPADEGVISTRGFEAFRQGVQEYKRLHVLYRRNVGVGLLDAWADLALSSKCSVHTLDRIRQAMDAKLIRLSQKRPATDKAKKDVEGIRP